VVAGHCVLEEIMSRGAMGKVAEPEGGAAGPHQRAEDHLRVLEDHEGAEEDAGGVALELGVAGRPGEEAPQQGHGAGASHALGAQPDLQAAQQGLQREYAVSWESRPGRAGVYGLWGETLT
jgi:hypothetical protein